MRGYILISPWPLLLSLSIVATLVGPAIALPNDHFIEYFPGYAPVFEYYAVNNCSEILEQYRNKSKPGCPSHAEFPQCISGPAVTCLMEPVPEVQKGNLAAAAVVLGLLPSILSQVGTTAVDSGLLARRRPLLALLLAVGAPVVAPVRMIDLATDFKGGDYIRYAVEVLEVSGMEYSRKRPMLIAGMSCFQYLIVIAAGAHTLYTSIELGVKAVCSFSTDSTFLPILWAITALPIHIGGAVAIRLRFELQQDTGSEPVESWWKQAFTPCALHKQPLKLQERKKSIQFVILSWAITIGTVVHMLFGTLVLSATLFVNTVDALWLALRYLTSTVLCRAVCAFEVDGLASQMEVLKFEDYEQLPTHGNSASGATEAGGDDRGKVS